MLKALFLKDEKYQICSKLSFDYRTRTPFRMRPINKAI